jgi:hypothetical protein
MKLFEESGLEFARNRLEVADGHVVAVAIKCTVLLKFVFKSTYN